MLTRRCVSGVLTGSIVFTLMGCTSPDGENRDGKTPPPGAGASSAPPPEKRLVFTWRSEATLTAEQKVVAATAEAWERAYWRLAATPDRDEPGITRYGTPDWARTVDNVLGRGNKPMGGRVEAVLVRIKIQADRAFADLCRDERGFGPLGSDGRPSPDSKEAVKDDRLELVPAPKPSDSAQEKPANGAVRWLVDDPDSPPSDFQDRCDKLFR